jgi:hypothetical protein
MPQCMRRSSETNIFCMGMLCSDSIVQTNLNMTGGPQTMAYVLSMNDASRLVTISSRTLVMRPTGPVQAGSAFYMMM